MYNVITMKASIIKIGNSRGIRIPKLLLKEGGFDKEVELRLKAGEIRINPVKQPLKKKIAYSQAYLMSLSALNDWNKPEEDKAWAHLQ